jgi:hypothetical protein
LARLLPDPARVFVSVFLVDPPAPDPGDGGPIDSGPPGTGDDPPPPVALAMSELDLDVFGWIRVAANPPELEYRLNAAAQRGWRAVNSEPPPDSHIELGDRSGLGDLLAAARAAGDLLTSARALDPADLAHPAGPDAPPPTAATVELVAQRIRAVETWLDQLVTDLEAAQPTVPSTVDLLLLAASAGAAEAVPPPAADASVLATLAAAAAARLRPRRAASPFTVDPADPAGSLARARARSEELSGVQLPVAATFPNPLDATATADLASGATRLAGADRASVRAWLLAHARVRPAIAAFLAALDLAEVLGAAEHLDPRVTQVPTQPVDSWVGTAPSPRAGAVGIVVHSGYADRPPAIVAGLLLDAYSQAVPANGHDTGVAFHYDQPDAAPPQALLVAVHPDPSPQRAAGTWDLDTLLGVVASTFALARDRATAAELCTTAGVEVPDA